MNRVIYFENVPFHFREHGDSLAILHAEDPEWIILKNPLASAMKELGVQLVNGKWKGAIVTGKQPEKLFKTFSKNFKLIEAAGGIVLNDKRDILFIFRRGKWDLPKGKVDKGEQTDEASRREVQEETGLKEMTLKKKVGITYHHYVQDEKHILKATHWYYYTVKGKPKLIPQTEEDITDIQWIPTLRIKEPVSNTFANIKEILTEFFDTP